jgi:hypothetical protein
MRISEAQQIAIQLHDEHPIDILKKAYKVLSQSKHTIDMVHARYINEELERRKKYRIIRKNLV